MKNKVITEEAILKQLDIPDWRHMTKDKVVAFATALPYMDKDVAKAAIAQFPHFKDMSVDIVDSMKTSLDIACQEGGKSTVKAYELNEKIIASLSNRLDKPFLLPGERKQIIDAMIKISENIASIDQQNKGFLLSNLKQASILSVGATILGAAALGVKIGVKTFIDSV